MIIRRRKGRPWANTAAATGWGESTYAELAWDKSRSAATRWAIAGVVIGTLVALIVFAPATWLARAVASASNDQRAAGRRARHGLVGQRRGRADGRPGQPRRQRAARPPRLDPRPQGLRRSSCRRATRAA